MILGTRDFRGLGVYLYNKQSVFGSRRSQHAEKKILHVLNTA